MGVPAFYRWLVNKYPKSVVNAIEEEEEKIDASHPNPNGFEFDNLYLDMNAIIHPCFHPDDHHTSAPTSLQDVFDNMYDYIDRLFYIVRPRKLLFLAIDGVAPRAKMNQQRTRRFKTAKDNEVAELEEDRLREEFEKKGKPVLPKQESTVWDSNVITPGTMFMYQLSMALQSYVCQRLENDAGWQDIKVILSDANVPGEGEHKIMSFIRLQRTFPDYNPNTRHCLYGLDADLIMLALATHEVHFSILRENVLVQEQQSSCETTLESKILTVESGLARSRGSFNQACVASHGNASSKKKPYQFLHIWLLREYLALDMEISDLPANTTFDVERIIDDFIFICFFTGNDFLPHMPTLEIHEGAVDYLMHVYKKEFKNLGGYLVDMQFAGEREGRYIKLKRVERYILSVGSFEERIFKKRSELHERKLRRLIQKEEEDNQCEDAEFDVETKQYNSANGENQSTDDCESMSNNILKNTKELKEMLKCYMRERSNLFKNGSFTVDKVKLGSLGWRERYYKEKFLAETKGDIESKRKDIVEKYTEGLCWVLLYYFSGIPSWTWYYPYHYGTFASDLKGISQVKVKFQLGSPFKPFDQLMSVLPPRSAHALPKAYGILMTNEDSKLIAFYPTDFEIDTSGKHFLWQGVCKLPFIDEDLLLSETKNLKENIEEAEALRNKEENDQLFLSSCSALGLQAVSLYKKQLNKVEMIKEPIETSGEIRGFISLCNKFPGTTNASSPKDDHNNIEADTILFVRYELPNQRPHVPRPLEGVVFPEETIHEEDIVESELWHESQGGWRRNRSQVQQKQRNEAECRNYEYSYYHDGGLGHDGQVSNGRFSGRGFRPAMSNRESFGGLHRFNELRMSDSRRGANHNSRPSRASSSAYSTIQPTAAMSTNHQRRGNVQSPTNHEWRQQSRQSSASTSSGIHWQQNNAFPNSLYWRPRPVSRGWWPQANSAATAVPSIHHYRPRPISQGWRAQHVQPTADAAAAFPSGRDWRPRNARPTSALPTSSYDTRPHVQSTSSAPAPVRGWSRREKSSVENSHEAPRSNNYSPATTPPTRSRGRGGY